MPEDRTPMDHGLAHPQPERGRIPQPLPRKGEDDSELVPNQPTHEEEPEPGRGTGGHTNFIQTPD